MDLGILSEKLDGLLWQVSRLRKENEDLRILLGRVAARVAKGEPDPVAAEFRVFSQFGEDGILAWILARIPIERKIFVEFGVENYMESNTRFLLLSDQGWRGLIMDGDERHMKHVESEPWIWRQHLEAKPAFVTRENIDGLLAASGIEGDIGLLSIDIDGNDLWVWERIESIAPRVVVCEYNALFGPDRAVAVPYREDFDLFKAHYSGLYWGASIAAFDRLAKEKGYRLVAGNSTGHNVFFVREDLCEGLSPLTPGQAWRPPQFRIGRERDGGLSLKPWEEGVATLSGMEVVEWDTASGGARPSRF